MIDLILNDSKLRPDLFSWRGSVPVSEVEKWEREQGGTIPEDIKQIWKTKGGGDWFESETILQPSGASEDDLVLPRSRWFWENGLTSDYYVFHEGLYISVFRISNNLLCSLTSEGFDQIGTFRTMDEWYLCTLRAEYGERYGLPPIR